VSLNGDLQEKRDAPEGESEEDKAKLDKVFQDKLDEQKKKLESENKLNDWIYKVSKWSVEPAIFKKSDLIKEKEKAEDGDTTSVTPNPSTLNPNLPNPSSLNLDPLNTGLDALENNANQVRKSIKDAMDASAKTVKEAVKETVDSVEKAVEPDPKPESVKPEASAPDNDSQAKPEDTAPADSGSEGDTPEKE